MNTPDPRNPRAIELGRKAMDAAVIWDEAGAIAALKSLADETGMGGLMDVILDWCDTLIQTIPGLQQAAQSEGIQLKWMEDETRRMNSGPEEVRPTAVWVGRLIAARAARDKETFDALIESVPSEPRTAMTDHVWDLLQTIALNLRRTLPEYRNSGRG